MYNKNVVLDFTNNEKNLQGITANQEVAIMPAHLAKELLYHWAMNLHTTSLQAILDDYATSIVHSKSIDEAMAKSVEFIQTRELVHACATCDWDKYTVKKAVNDNPIGYGEDN